MINLKIDPEFQSQIPPLTDDEFKQLEENILKEGKLLSPLIVWNNTLVDGHNRYEIVQEHPEISFSTMPLPFEIENTGFGRVFQETELFLIMKNRNETREVPISMDMRKIQAGTRICGKTVIKLMEGRVSLKLQRKKDGRIIHFANKNSTDTLYLGSLHCGKIYLSEE